MVCVVFDDLRIFRSTVMGLYPMKSSPCCVYIQVWHGLFSANLTNCGSRVYIKFISLFFQELWDYTVAFHAQIAQLFILV